MVKKALRVIAILLCVVAAVGFILMPLLDPRFSYRGEWHILIPVVAYSSITGLALAAATFPSVPQWLRFPGVIANVLLAMYVIGGWAQWITGNMPMKGASNIVPVLGITALYILLLWLLEFQRVFRPSPTLSFAVGGVTFLAFLLYFTNRNPRSLDFSYPRQLERLDTIATAVGTGYFAAALVWVASLVVGIREALNHGKGVDTLVKETASR
jgi:hypothetical protein